MNKDTLPKNRLYEFNCEIYPRKLWIVVDNQRLVKKRFIDLSTDEPINDEYFDKSYAVTAVVQENKEGYLGVLIHFNKDFLGQGGCKMVSDITHECVHALDCLYIEISAKHDIYNDEPSAYLAGWFALKCWEVLQNYVDYGREHKNTTKR